ncbi:response regulator [Planctomycetota bacterium]
MKFLIVEDDFTSRRLLQQYLSEHGTCLIAVSGKEALQAVKESLENNDPYDLICLDIMMPEMDGQECLKYIREIEAKRGIRCPASVKVIMISSLTDTANMVTAYCTGCEFYLVKPIDRKKLLSVMTDLGVLQPSACG